MTPDVVTPTYSWGSIRCDRSKADRQLRREIVFQAYDKDGGQITLGSARVIRPEADGKWHIQPGPMSGWLEPSEARVKARVLLAAADECDMRNQATS
jgi:hypothetical protein